MADDKYKVTRLNKSNLKAGLDLIEEVNYEAYGEYDSENLWATNGWKESWLEYIENGLDKNEVIVVGVQDLDTKQIVSCGVCVVLKDTPSPWSIDGEYGFIRSMSTKPEHRSKGHGKLIMDEIHKWAREKGLNNIRLNTSKDAQAFYERAGYEIFPYPAMAIWFDEQQE